MKRRNTFTILDRKKQPKLLPRRPEPHVEVDGEGNEWLVEEY